MTKPVGPLASTGFWVKQVALAWQRELDRSLRDLGLTSTQFSILAGVGWLGREGRSPGQQDVADFAGADRMMTSKVLAGLEHRGLVERRPDAADGRVRRLATTTAGQAVLVEAATRARRVDHRFFGDDDDLRERLSAVMAATPDRSAAPAAGVA